MVLPQARRTLVKISIYTRVDLMLVTLARVCMCKTQSEVYVICQLDSRSVSQTTIITQQVI